MKGFLVTITLTLLSVFTFGQTNDTIQNNTSSVPGTSSDARIMKLDECIEYAFENNENVIIANLETEIARAKVGEVMSSGFPQINGNFSVNKNTITRKSDLPAIIFDPNAGSDEFVKVSFSVPYDGDLGLNVSQMIFNGSYFVGLKASKTYQELSKKDHIKSKIDVVEAVTKAYYTVLVNEIFLETAEANLQRLDSLLRETTIMQNNGFVEKIDLNRTKVEYNNVNTFVNNMRRTVTLSKELLKFQMGMPINENIEIGEGFDDLEFNVDEVLTFDSDYKNRIEYSQWETNNRLAELDLKNNRVQYLPNIDLLFNWGKGLGTVNSDNILKFNNEEAWSEYQTVGLRLQLPIFDGLYKAKKIQQNKIALKQLMYQREMLKNSINLEVEQSRKNLVSSIESLENQKENMSLAEEVYNHSKIKYQEGVGSNLEVIDADNAFKDAQSNYFSALYDALISHVEYQKALGILYQETHND